MDNISIAQDNQFGNETWNSHIYQTNISGVKFPDHQNQGNDNTQIAFGDDIIGNKLLQNGNRIETQILDKNFTLR